MSSSTAMFHSISVRTARSCAGALQAVQRLEKGLERSRRQRLQRVHRLMTREGVEAVALIDPLGFVGEEHRIAVEGDAQLTGVPARLLARFGIDARRRTVGL